MELSGFNAADAVGLDRGQSNADMMKNIRKARLERQVFEDPGLARKLMVTEATGTYNADGDIVQAVSTDLGSA